METTILRNKILTEVVFEGRNKAYGAFVLRRDYDRIMSWSMVISIFVFLLGFSMPSILHKWIGAKIEESITYIADIPIIQESQIKREKIVKAPVKPNVPSAPKPQKPQMQWVPPAVIRDNEEIDVLPPTQSELSDNIIGNTNITGDSSGIDPGLIEGPVSINTQEIVAEKTETGPISIYKVEQKPEFPGGEEKLNKYVRDHLHIPSDLYAGQLNIIMQFVIDNEGKVRDVKVLRSSTKQMDQSAVNLIKGMPLWKPGKQNGNAVSVVLVLPIRIQFE